MCEGHCFVLFCHFAHCLTTLAIVDKIWYFYRFLCILATFDFKLFLFDFQRTVEKRLALFMREGHWFVSLYNDFGDAQTVDFVAALSLEMTEGCPNGCNGHGECVLGRCQCESGYGGEDCSEGKII